MSVKKEEKKRDLIKCAELSGSLFA